MAAIYKKAKPPPMKERVSWGYFFFPFLAVFLAAFFFLAIVFSLF